jgi:hypothetical protein
MKYLYTFEFRKRLMRVNRNANSIPPDYGAERLLCLASSIPGGFRFNSEGIDNCDFWIAPVTSRTRLGASAPKDQRGHLFGS